MVDYFAIKCISGRPIIHEVNLWNNRGVQKWIITVSFSVAGGLCI